MRGPQAGKSAGVNRDARPSLQRDLGNRGIFRQQRFNTTAGDERVQGGAAPRQPAAAGSPLPAGTRKKMEGAFQSDFSSVRVKTNPGLAKRGISALTRGELIEFSSSPRRDGDEHALLGHELTHVLQQREGSAVDTLNTRSGRAGLLERDAAHAGMRAAKGLPVNRAAIAQGPPVSVMQAAGPLTDAVDAVRAHGPGVGSSMVTEQLVQGILEAEGEFLRMSPGNRLAESLGMSGTVGPGQLGQPAITDVDSNFSAAATQFAGIHGAAPSGWEAKATHPEWSYFYIAAYLAFSINRAASVFHASPRVMSDQDLGVLELGIAIYHGAFATVRDMRRRIAGEQGVTPGDVSWGMVQDELRSGTATHEEMGLERYTMLAQGRWDFGFEIQAAMLSRRFDIGAGGKLRVTILANYSSATAATGSRAGEFTVELRKREVACSMGACGEGYNIVGRFRFTVGARGVAEWTELAPGTYQLYIRKLEDPYSPDRLVGQGRAETIY